VFTPDRIAFRVVPLHTRLACSKIFKDPLFSLQSPSSARDKKSNRGEFIDRQRKVVGVGEEKNRRSALVLALTAVFEKIRKNNKTK